MEITTVHRPGALVALACTLWSILYRMALGFGGGRARRECGPRDAKRRARFLRARPHDRVCANHGARVQGAVPEVRDGRPGARGSRTGVVGPDTGDQTKGPFAVDGPRAAVARLSDAKTANPSRRDLHILAGSSARTGETRPPTAYLPVSGVYSSRLAFTRISTLPLSALLTGQPWSACSTAL
jgi:hypothetical protein